MVAFSSRFISEFVQSLETSLPVLLPCNVTAVVTFPYPVTGPASYSSPSQEIPSYQRPQKFPETLRNAEELPT